MPDDRPRLAARCLFCDQWRYETYDEIEVREQMRRHAMVCKSHPLRVVTAERDAALARAERAEAIAADLEVRLLGRERGSI